MFDRFQVCSVNCVTPIKYCTDKQNESDLGRAWRHVYIPFLRDSNVILSVIEFLSDGRYRMQFHNFRPRIFGHLHLLLNFLWLVVTATVNLHSIANSIAFHNF